jgi:hypothetical protein
MEHGNVKPDTYYLPEGVWAKARNLIVIIGAIAWLLTAVGAFTNPKQFFFSYLAAYWYVTVITLGGIFWMMVQFVTGAAASASMRRIMENIAASIPTAALLFIPLVFGLHDLYVWTHPDVVAHDPVLLDRGAYFHTSWFLFRVIVYIGVWCFFALKIYQHATRMDRTTSVVAGLAESKWAERWSAPGLIFLFITATGAAWEWIMSLDARAFSTIFGVYCLANGALACIAVITLIGLWLCRNGLLENTITIEHYHDLGKWMFAVTVFWAYAAFAQYMLIWYANIPEETQYFFHRFQGSWYALSIFQIFGHFLFPFVFLMGRSLKRRYTTLAFASVYLLVICYIDVYWMVLPMLHKTGIQVHWLDLTSVVAVGSVFAFVFWQRMKSHALVPVGDIRLVHSLAFRNQ